jgi:hypothetical protein
MVDTWECEGANSSPSPYDMPGGGMWGKLSTSTLSNISFTALSVHEI